MDRASPLTPTPARRLFAFGVLVLAYIVAGSVIAWIAGWPPQFGGNPDPEQSYVSYLLGGSAISAPLAPAVALLVGLLLAQRKDRWRILGFILITIVAILFVIGVSGELFAEHPFVPAAVVVGFGVINIGVALALLYLVFKAARARSA